MTDDMMTLRTLLEKSSDTDLLREMIGFTARRLMELEIEGLTGAAHGERSPERMNQRNGSYFPGFLEPRRLAEKALAAVVHRFIRSRYAPRRLKVRRHRASPTSSSIFTNP